MLKDKTFWKIHFKWGVIAGALLAGIEILKMLARQVDYQSAQLLDLAMIIGFILVLHFGVKEFKEVYPARLTFAKAFLSCIVISFIGAAVLFGYDMLHYSVIEKDGLQKKYTVALEKYRQNLAKDTLTNAELMAYTDAASALLNERKDRICNDSSVVQIQDRGYIYLAISGFFGQHQFTQWGYVFAMSVLTLIPVVLIFILCQKFFVQGLTAGSVKG